MQSALLIDDALLFRNDPALRDARKA